MDFDKRFKRLSLWTRAGKLKTVGCTIHVATLYKQEIIATFIIICLTACVEFLSLCSAKFSNLELLWTIQ